MKGHAGQRQQCRLEGFDQTRVAHIGDVSHVDRAGVPAAQHRNGIMGSRDIHFAQGATFSRSPGQGFGFVVQVQPVQAGGMHLRINPRLGEQALRQLWIKVLGPMRECSDSRAVAPRIQRRDNATTRPGGLLSQPRALQQHHGLPLGRQVERRQQADDPATDNHYLLLLCHHLIQPINRNTRTWRPVIQHSHHCPQHSLRDISGAAPGLVRAPVLARLKSPQRSPVITEPTRGVATSWKS